MGDSLFQVSDINCNENDNTSFYPMHILLSSNEIEKKISQADYIATSYARALGNKISDDLRIKPFFQIPYGIGSREIKAATIAAGMYKTRDVGFQQMEKLGESVAPAAEWVLDKIPDVGFLEKLGELRTQGNDVFTSVARNTIWHPNVPLIMSSARDATYWMSGKVGLGSMASSINGIATNVLSNDPHHDHTTIILRGLIVSVSYLALTDGNIVNRAVHNIINFLKRASTGLIYAVKKVFGRLFSLLTKVIDVKQFTNMIYSLLNDEAYTFEEVVSTTAEQVKKRWDSLIDEHNIQEMFPKMYSIITVKTKEGWNALMDKVSWSDLNKNTSATSKALRFTYIAAALFSYSAITIASLTSPTAIAATIAFQLTSQFVLASLAALDTIVCIKDCVDYRRSGTLDKAAIRKLCEDICHKRPGFGVSKKWKDHFDVKVWLGFIFPVKEVEFARLVSEISVIGVKTGKKIWDTRKAVKIPVIDIKLDAGYRSFLITQYPEITNTKDCEMQEIAIANIARSKREPVGEKPVDEEDLAAEQLLQLAVKKQRT